MIFISTKNQNGWLVCTPLITIDDNSCYFIINIFRRGCKWLHRLELLRQAQEKDGNSGHQLTGKQPAAIELTHWVHSTTTRLHYHYIGIRELRLFTCGDYRSDLLFMGTMWWWPFIYMWRHLLAATGGSSKLLLYCWYAALFCCAEWRMRVLCRHNYSLFHEWPTCLRLGSTWKFLDNSRSTNSYRAGHSRCGAPLSSDFMTTPCSVNRVTIVVERPIYGAALQRELSTFASVREKIC